MKNFKIIKLHTWGEPDKPKICPTCGAEFYGTCYDCMVDHW